jgi:hypothetical protein
MSKRFFELSNAEMLALDNDGLNTAIRIEAIERGIQPPVPLSEALRRSEWMGYQKPAEAVQVWEIQVEKHYSGTEPSGVGYFSKEAAEKAMEGMVSVVRNYDKAITLKNGGPGLVVVNVSVSKAEQKGVKFQEFQQSTEEFDKVADECVEHLSRLRQREYNTKVRAEKKAEYLRLAGGNEQVARNFWAKVETSAWDGEQPEEEPKPAPEPVPFPSIEDEAF